MKTCKKLFSLLLVAVMLVAAIPTFAFAADESYELILNVDGQAVYKKGSRPTAPFDSDTLVDGPSSTPTTDGLNFLSEFPNVDSKYTGLTSPYTVTEVVVNKTQKMIRVELASSGTSAPSHTHNYNTLVPNSGDATGHDMKCSCGDVQKVPHGSEHYIVENKKDATCITKGWTGNKKYDCGYTEMGAEIAATGVHTYGTDGKCTVCGATKPGTSSTSTKKTINVVVDGTTTIYTEKTYTGAVDAAHAQDILTAAGSSVSLSNYDVVAVKENGNEITVTLTKKAYAGYTLNLTVYASNGTSTTTKYQNVSSFSGNTSDVSAVLTAFNVTGYDLVNGYDVTKNTYDNSTKTFEIVLAAKPTAANKYTVNCVVNGIQFASKTDVTYTGSFESNFTNAQAILDKAGIQKTASEYKKVTITKSNTNVVTVDLRNTVVVRVYNNANSYSEVTMDVGQPYVNYLGTNLINNSTFGGITVKDTSDRNTYYSASAVNGRTALVSAFDKEITIQRNGDSCTLYFLRSDGTVLESRKLYAGDQIGTLPSYIVGNVPAVWTYNGKPISATDVYNFKTTSVNIVPYFGGISDVYVDVYTNGNVKTMQTRVKVTDLVQNGVLYLNSEVKSSISSALRNSSNKNLTYTAFFDASTWSDFIKTKNTNGAAEPIRVGDNSERQGAVYLYVMVNNVTQKATDSTNPKTGDDVKLGVAAAVLAVAVVGFGAAIVIKKKKGVQ